MLTHYYYTQHSLKPGITHKLPCVGCARGVDIVLLLREGELYI